MLDVEDLPPNSKAVRHVAGRTFDWSVVATLDGDVLTLRMFNPGAAQVVPGLSEWRAYAERYFPAAKRVRFERRNRGVSRWVERSIRP